MGKSLLWEEALAAQQQAGVSQVEGLFAYGSSTGVIVGTGSVPGREYLAVETLPAPPRKPRGWAALEVRVGMETITAMDVDVIGGAAFCMTASRRWSGVVFRVYRSGEVAAVADGVEVARAPAPAYPRGNGGSPPWPEVVLGRLVLLGNDETLLFGDAALGGIEPAVRSVRLRE